MPPNEKQPRANSIGRLDMLIYRIFRWRWNPILEHHPGILKGMYDGFGKTLDVRYPGLREKHIDWIEFSKKKPEKPIAPAKIYLVVDNTKKDTEHQPTQ